MNKGFHRSLETILLVGLILVLILPIVVYGQTQSETTTSPQERAMSPRDDASVSKQTKTLDATGEKIGKGIEKFGEKTSSHIGSWIDAKIFAGITLMKMLVSFFILLCIAFVERILRWIIQKKLTDLPPEEAIVWTQFLLRALSRPLSLFIWVYGIYFALSPLLFHFRDPDGTNLIQQVALKVTDIGGAVALIWFIFRSVQFVDVHLKKWAASTESTLDDMLAPLVGKTLRIFVILIGSIIIIQNLTGLKIGPLLASLGIGGLAVALAAKESIANFFGTLTILFDKPFQIGERIIIGGNDGVVESVGFRSTRIRTLTGHLLTMPNEKIVSSTIENIGKRPHIRWLTNIGITYDTPPEKAEKAVRMIREILDKCYAKQNKK
ncbi:mechanosensitive ion channel family protein [Thermodesulfobacteriota bacterium]